MKKCPVCNFENEDKAIKCKECEAGLAKKEAVVWYLKTSTLIIAFLCIGPFALPLLWFNPRFSLQAKIILSIIVVVISYYLGVMMVNSLKSVTTYYKMMFQSY